MSIIIIVSFFLDLQMLTDFASRISLNDSYEIYSGVVWFRPTSSLHSALALCRIRLSFAIFWTPARFEVSIEDLLVISFNYTYICSFWNWPSTRLYVLNRFDPCSKQIMIWFEPAKFVTAFLSELVWYTRIMTHYENCTKFQLKAINKYPQCIHSSIYFPSFLENLRMNPILYLENAIISGLNQEEPDSAKLWRLEDAILDIKQFGMFGDMAAFI